jgi:hypothetical protein
MSFAVENVQRLLSRRSGMRCDLIINENHSNMLAVLGRGPDWARISIHRMFLEAPESVINAIARYVAACDKSAFSLIRAYITANVHRFNYSHRVNPRLLEARGEVYNLQKIYDKINAEYFEDRLRLMITWQNRLPKKNCSRIVYGQYFQTLRLIKINRLLDDAYFPNYFVSFVVYHEMLHHAIPHYVDENGITKIHSIEFKEREKQFKHYRKAKEWELEFRRSFFAELN